MGGGVEGGVCRSPQYYLFFFFCIPFSPDNFCLYVCAAHYFSILLWVSAFLSLIFFLVGCFLYYLPQQKDFRGRRAGVCWLWYQWMYCMPVYVGSRYSQGTECHPTVHCCLLYSSAVLGNIKSKGDVSVGCQETLCSPKWDTETLIMETRS